MSVKSVAVKCTKCGKYDASTPTTTRCTDCCFLKRRDASNRLLANRCRDCCPSGHGVHDVPPTLTITLVEHIELLEGVKHNYESRILSVDTPTYVASHVASLKKRAEDLYDAAVKIEMAITEDTKRVDELVKEYMRVECELTLCKSELAKGVKRISKGYLKWIVERFMRRLSR